MRSSKLKCPKATNHLTLPRKQCVELLCSLPQNFNSLAVFFSLIYVNQLTLLISKKTNQLNECYQQTKLIFHASLKKRPLI